MVALVVTAACGSGEETVQPATTPPTTSTTPGQDPTRIDDPANTRDEAPAVPTPTGQAGTPSPTPQSPAPALALRTRRPVDGFDLDPPEGFSAVEDDPMHGVSMVADGHRVGIRFYGKHGTGQSVLVAVWSDRAEGAAERLERYRAHTGDVAPGRPVRGASAVWELKERSSVPEASTVVNLAAYMLDGTLIWLSGLNIDDVSTLYEFLTRIEDAPGSLVARPDPGVAVPGGARD